jgi:adenosylmethionine-8-amino-7-oxononanoate aminotransferase
VGASLLGQLRVRLGDHPHVGDIRGIGSMLAVEFVADRERNTPFGRDLMTTERIRAAMIERGVVPYPLTGCADGESGDGFMLGPPFVVDDAEIELIVDAAESGVGAVLG